MKSLLAIAAFAVALLLFAVPASANDRFTLDPAPDSAGHVVVDSAGTAYVTWTHNAGGSEVNPVRFCEIPLGGTCSSPKTLPIPGAVDDTDDVSGVFPVLGPGTTVYVVGPRYVSNDIIVWTSLDGGQTFNSGTEVPGGYSSKSEPSNVILFNGEFAVGAFNPGLSFGVTPAAGTGTSFSFTGVPDTVESESLAAVSPNTLVEAFWTLGSSGYRTYFYRYKGSGIPTSQANWEGPTEIGKGYETKLAGGAGGVFLVSQDVTGGETPSAVNVRKYTGSGFGAPVTLANDASVDLFAGGAIAESPSGHVAVAWPTGDAKVMRLFSSNDGTSFTQTNIAHIGGAYSINDNAQLAVTDSGAGWLTFMDEHGLQMADTAPIAEPPAEPPPPYKGKEKTTSTKVGGFELTLRLPQSCLQQGQSFYAGAGKRVRHKVGKAVHSKLTLKSAAFSFDGKKLKTLKKKPLKLLINPGTLAPGSVHTVKVKITAVTRGKGVKPKKVVRTLKGTIKIC